MHLARPGTSSNDTNQRISRRLQHFADDTRSSCMRPEIDASIRRPGRQTSTAIPGFARRSKSSYGYPEHRGLHQRHEPSSAFSCYRCRRRQLSLSCNHPMPDTSLRHEPSITCPLYEAPAAMLVAIDCLSRGSFIQQSRIAVPSRTRTVFNTHPTRSSPQL